MPTVYTRDVTILPSRVDAGGRLSHVHAFDLFMDTATQAAGALGLGWDYLIRKGLFWITVKARICFDERPALLDEVRIVTWPEQPDERRCNRHYELRRDGRTLMRGKTEWAIVGVGDGKPRPMSEVFPADLEFPSDIACPEPFPRIDGPFEEAPFALHKVRSSDIDMARHMNNVAYVRAIVDAFSVAEWERMDVRQIDMIFLHSAREGDALAFRRCRCGDGLDIVGTLEDGRPCVMARLVCAGA